MEKVTNLNVPWHYLARQLVQVNPDGKSVNYQSTFDDFSLFYKSPFIEVSVSLAYFGK